MGYLAYQLALPAELASDHIVFHVFMFIMFLGDPAMILHVEDLGSLKTCRMWRYILRFLIDRSSG